MSSDLPSGSPIIHARAVTKHYRIRSGPPVSLHETLGHWLRGSRPSSKWHEFSALRDFDLVVEMGEKVAFLGHNGAGKSTFLKLVCRITSPSSGSITLRGRVASMLEVGTGFHPELSGRDNIFLNGAILGLSRREVLDRLDRILSFAEIDGFIDTPVKHYSTGMFVRLAFAVAAHTDPDILVIDEVLAVGDQAFRAKCIGHLSSPAQSNRTMLIVSHDLEILTEIATRGVVLDHGRKLFDGPIAQAVAFQRELLPKTPKC
jgi:ABC-type polysaccharide/polyol phosphate transport system ATPase subunit